MLQYFLQGLTLGLAYVAPIGMQNLYVINTTISKGRKRAYQVALITSFFDISLALACFYGVGLVMDRLQLLKMLILGLGSIAVIYIGIKLLGSKPDMKDTDVDKSLIQIIATCFAVTWINPQALIDGTLLLGGFRASLPAAGFNLFILGVCIASLSWFVGVTTIVSVFRNSMGPRAIRVINMICGSVIIFYGLKLGYSLLQLLNIFK